MSSNQLCVKDSGLQQVDPTLSYQHLTCSEVLPGPGQLVDFLPQPTPLSMDISASCPICPHTYSSLPSLVVESGAKGELEGVPYQQQACSKSKPTLHVEVCQHAHSSMRMSKLKCLVRDMLMERGTAFHELVMHEFDDPIFKEHLVSVSITDTPNELKVGPPPTMI